MDSLSFEQLTHEFFARLVNADFRVPIGDGDSVVLRLSEITPLQIVPMGGTSGPQSENFSLHFLGSSDRVLPQQIYAFESAAHGRFELFIVPIARDQNGTRYEAIFSRLVKSA